VQIIAVQKNQTQMQVPPELLGIKAMQVHSYLEVLGVLVAHKTGINPAFQPNHFIPTLPIYAQANFSPAPCPLLPVAEQHKRSKNSTLHAPKFS